jgi:aminoglycoside phosphotransferase (APT) family kinase protein
MGQAVTRQQEQFEDPPRPAATSGQGAPHALFEDSTALQAALARFLSADAGNSVHIERLQKFPAGFSWITYGVKLRGYPRSDDMILRIGPPYGLFAPYSALPEFESLSALEGSGVPVPRAFAASDDSSILGAPFFLCERVTGDTPLPWGGGGGAMDDARRKSLAIDFVDALAALHRFDWQHSKLASWADGITADNAADRQLDYWWDRFQRWALRSHPMAHRTFAWLRRNKPRASRVTLVHGDYRLGNFLERDGRITAILDWELVHLGDPIEDLGWAFLPQYRGGTRMVCQLADEDAFLSRYQDKAGYRVDRDALRFYIVFSLLKLALTHMAAARCFEDGLFNDMRMPAMATQIAPVFRQIAKIMERGS